MGRRIEGIITNSAAGSDGKTVNVATADPDDDKKVAKAISRAGPIVRSLDAALTALRDAMADQLLDLHNTTWRGEGLPLSRRAFKARLSLSSVVVAPNRTTACFECDGLFTDHGIEVRLAPDGRVREICIS